MPLNELFGLTNRQLFLSGLSTANLLLLHHYLRATQKVYPLDSTAGLKLLRVQAKPVTYRDRK